MNVSDFTYLLNHPEAINEKRTDELDKIVAEFPYFQSARALRLKGLYIEDSFRYNYALKVTAAFTADRSVLFDFITSENFASVKQTDSEKEEVLAKAEPEIPESHPVQELTVDESFRASLDTEFVRAEEIAQDQSHVSVDADFAVADSGKAEELVSEAIEVPEIESAETQESFENELSGETDLAEEISEEPIETDLEPETVWEPEFEQEEVSGIDESEPETESPEIESESEESEFAEEESELEESEADENAEPEYDAATRSVLDSIKEAEQYAKSLSVTEPEEVLPEDSAETAAEIEEIAEPSDEEKSLEIGKPLEFAQSEVHSFHEWLQLSQFKPIVRDEAVLDSPVQEETEAQNDDSETDSERQKKNELIDKFIQANPKIPKITPEAKAPSFIFEPSQPDNSYLMTETLARVYLEQKKYDKAIQAYEILILKYPEKSSFFADRILDIKTLQQNNKP